MNDYEYLRRRAENYVIDKEAYHNLIIEDVWIPKNECIIGKIYLCNSRNFHLGHWNGINFDYIRFKFYEHFPDTEFHWDDSAPHGTVKPFMIVGEMNGTE